MKPVIPQDRRPALLGRSPRLQTLDQVQHALKLLAWFASRQKTVDLVTQQSIALLRDQAAKECRLTIDGEEVSYAAYSETIEQAIRDYVRASPDLWSVRRTVEFPCGTVAVRKSLERVELAHEQEKSAWLEWIEDRIGLAAKCVALLKRLKLWPFVRLRAEVNIAGVKAAYREGAVTRKDLEELGFRVLGGEDEVVITPRLPKAAA